MHECVCVCVCVCVHVHVGRRIYNNCIPSLSDHLAVGALLYYLGAMFLENYFMP